MGPRFGSHFSETRNENNIDISARFPLAQALKITDLDRPNEFKLEMIDPRPLPPWHGDAFTEVEIEQDSELETAREQAETARSTSDITLH